jgi:signal transduction histidine kinase
MGDVQYSFIFPLVTNVTLCILSELFAYGIAKNPLIVGIYIIFINVALVIYFAFRDGLIGGYVTTVITILYYFYIIQTRHYRGQALTSGIETTFLLTFIYLLLATTIGWLKQTIDKLIEREANEKKHLETIIQQLPVGILITDANAKLTRRNKQVDSILGIKIPIGFRFGEDTLADEKIDDKPIIPTKAPILKALTTGKPVLGKEYTYKRNDKKLVTLRVSSAPIQNKKKKTIAAVSIITNITHQKELERQKDDFLSLASHELKTPLTSLKMFIDLQKTQLSKKDVKKLAYYNQRIGDQADKLKELVNDLLSVSRIQTGKLRFTIESFDISEIISDTVEGLQATAANHTIQISNKKKYIVKGDKYRIYQVLVNLISNAIKYSPNGKRIIVHIEKIKQDVVVSVQDFGIGIGKEQQGKIFNKLYQVSDSTERTFPGLGLGLYISKEIVIRHKGKIWVESTKDNGSTFLFSLPLSKSK